VLNFFVVVYDMVQAYSGDSVAFMVSAILRLIVAPLLSVFHLGVGFVFRRKCKDTLLKSASIVCDLLSIVLFVAVIVLIVYFRSFNTILQLQALHPPSNFSVPFVPRRHANSVCSVNYESVSVWEMVGYALGPHEVFRDPVLFDSQMQYFFGQEWRSRFIYETRTFNEMPVMVYEEPISNVTIVGLRSSASGPELAFQLELFAWTYILPMLTDIAPLYDVLTESRVPYLASGAQHFGNAFFDVRPIPLQFVDPILAYLDELGIEDEEKDFILVGIGTGGVLAKTIGMLRSRPAFAFWSMPAFEGSYSANFDFDEMGALFITNIYNYAGGQLGFRLAAEEPGVANNLGIPWIEGAVVAPDNRFRSLCTMFAMCAEQGILTEYCYQTIDDMDDVVAAFADDAAE
jgi:hypothetical protein